MRSVIVAAAMLAAQVVLVAQLPIPRDLNPILRKVPTADSLLRGTPPLSTGFDDTAGAQPLLDGVTWGTPRPLSELARTPAGGFSLQPGHWEGTFQSFCLRTAAYSPGKGEGYLYAPYRGSKADAIQTILIESARHPDVDQGDIQMLLWGILSRSRIQTMAPRLRATARALLTAAQIRDIDSSALDLIPPSRRAALFRRLPAGVRAVAEKEAELRYRFSRGVADYDEIQRVAVRAGVAPEDDNNKIARGQWARHPGGFWIRYFPAGFMTMRVEIMVPGRVDIRRDHLHRIVSIEDANGRTETVYDDSVPPRALPGDKRVRAYAFKSIRFVRNGRGAPQMFEVRDTGYAFVRAPGGAPVPGQAMRGGMPGFTLASFPRVSQDRFDRWAERGERAREAYERYEFYRDRADAAGRDPSADSVDDLGDIENYRDGVDAALGDPGDRTEWMIEQQERQNAALRWATSVLDSLPTGSSPEWDPSDGMAVPSGGGQRLGISGRSR